MDAILPIRVVLQQQVSAGGSVWHACSDRLVQQTAFTTVTATSQRPLQPLAFQVLPLSRMGETDGEGRTSQPDEGFINIGIHISSSIKFPDNQAGGCGLQPKVSCSLPADRHPQVPLSRSYFWVFVSASTSFNKPF